MIYEHSDDQILDDETQGDEMKVHTVLIQKRITILRITILISILEKSTAKRAMMI